MKKECVGLMRKQPAPNLSDMKAPPCDDDDLPITKGDLKMFRKDLQGVLSFIAGVIVDTAATSSQVSSLSEAQSKTKFDALKDGIMKQLEVPKACEVLELNDSEEEEEPEEGESDADSRNPENEAALEKKVGHDEAPAKKGSGKGGKKRKDTEEDGAGPSMKALAPEKKKKKKSTSAARKCVS